MCPELVKFITTYLYTFEYYFGTVKFQPVLVLAVHHIVLLSSEYTFIIFENIVHMEDFIS